MSVTNPAAATGHMCQIMPKAQIVLSTASTKPAPVFFGMWIGTKSATGRTWPRFFMSYQASVSWTMGVKAKL